jgi:hypothetical protein
VRWFCILAVHPPAPPRRRRRGALHSEIGRPLLVVVGARAGEGEAGDDGAERGCGGEVEGHAVQSTGYDRRTRELLTWLARQRQAGGIVRVGRAIVVAVDMHGTVGSECQLHGAGRQADGECAAGEAGLIDDGEL